MLSEIAAKQAQYKAEANAFLTIAKCPSSVSSSSYDFLTACKTGGTGWDDIRIQPTSSKLYCSYEVVADIPGSTLTPPP